MAAALTATWEEIKAAGAKPMARSAHGLASAHGTLYLFGGMYSDAEGNPMSLADMFQLSLDGKPQWRAMTPGGDVPVQRQGHTFNYVEALGQYFVFGGSNDDDGTEFNDVVSFDPSRNIWKQVKAQGTPPSPRLNHSASVHGSYIYVFGGFEDGTAKGDMYKLDTRMGKWSAIKTKGPSPRCNHAMATVDDRVFVIGGRAGEATLFNDVHVFDTNQETWSAPAITGPAPEARDFHTVVTFAHYIVLFGGAQEIEATDTNIHFNDVWALDTRAFKWTKVAVSGTAPSPRWGHAAAMIDNKMYTFGGTCNDIDFNDLFVLTLQGPAAPAPTTSTTTTTTTTTVAASTAAAAAAVPAVKKPVVVTRPAPAPVQPTPTSAPVTAAPTTTTTTTTTAAAAAYTPAEKPVMDYATAHPAPAARRTTVAPKLAAVGVRNFSAVEQRIAEDLKQIFDNIRAEYQQVDTARAQLNADREAFEKERADNEELFATQQRELATLKERHTKDTEAWLSARKAEIDAEKQKLAEGRAQLARENAHLQKETETLLADRATLTKEEEVFRDKSTKFTALMQQFQGIH